MTDGLEVGRWYVFQGSPMSLRGTAVKVVRVDGDTVLGRWASGMERLIMRMQIGEQVDDAVPGMTEPCLVCGGAQSLPVIGAPEGERGLGRRVGSRPCPNCRSLA